MCGKWYGGEREPGCSVFFLVREGLGTVGVSMYCMRQFWFLLLSEEVLLSEEAGVVGTAYKKVFLVGFRCSKFFVVGWTSLFKVFFRNQAS